MFLNYFDLIVMIGFQDKGLVFGVDCFLYVIFKDVFYVMEVFDKLIIYKNVFCVFELNIGMFF